MTPRPDTPRTARLLAAQAATSGTYTELTEPYPPYDGRWRLPAGLSEAELTDGYARPVAIREAS